MSALLTVWWVWMAVGLLLGIIEVLVPGFIFLGFGIGAVAVGVVLMLLPSVLGTATALSTAATLTLFALFSALAWIGLRRIFGVRRAEVKIWKSDING